MTTMMYDACMKALKYVTDDFVYEQRQIREELHEINKSLEIIAKKLAEQDQDETDLPW